ncbi:hypothetical protein SAMN06893096_101109 [Geodermatophilus pulveris]|uniref:Uncharacterized protein n=1 Tax=Geodermatophilus pulveris TaxID=1564159 RepID=A0A239AMW6_9ACTN|nr:hypothetical protein [Geodermatophilus pulveris]SNR96672.1 hypothetical protein SAMN06893096_101109 [Geodermatophilus pulveris]
MTHHVEPGGSWRPVRLAAGVWVALVVLELVLPGSWVPSLVLTLAAGALGGALGHTLMLRRTRTLRLDDAALTVGRERVRLAHVDAGHLRAVLAGTAGADAGAPLLGGASSLPRGRAALPLRLTDGRTVLVPTRDPAALTRALLAGVPDTTDRPPGRRGTLGS